MNTVLLSLVDIRESGWPLSLIKAVLGEVNHIPEDIEASIDFVLDKLGERRRFIILSRYRECMNYGAIGEMLELSGQGVQHNHKRAITLLQTPANRRFLMEGLQEIEDQKKRRVESITTEPWRWEARRQELAALVGMDNAEAIIRYEIREGTISITNLELPVRAQNQLRLDKIDTLVDLCQMTKLDLLKMRQVGNATRSAILHAMEEIGITLQEDDPEEAFYYS